jgi:hypothetical protein
VVIGVTDEPAKLVEKFIADNKVAYPIVIEKGFKSTGPLGVTGYPSSFLIDIQGNVIWSGHPAQLSEADVEKALVGAREPGYKLTAALKPLEKLLEKGEYAKAHAAAKTLLAGNLDAESQKAGQELVDQIEGSAKSLVEAAQKCATDQDWPEAVDKYEMAVKNYLGVPGTDGVDAKLKALQADPEVKKAIKGQEQLGKADALVTDKDFDKAYAIYKSVAKSYANLKCGEAAAKQVQEIEQKGMLGFEKNCPKCQKQGSACDKHKKKAK